MKYLLILVVALCLPLFLGITNVRLMATTPAFYAWGFSRHDVGATTGLSDAELRRVAQAFIDYFRAPPGRLDITVERDGVARPLFNEREILHMVDVQALMRTLGLVQLICGLGILAALIGSGLLERRPLGPTAGVALLAGAGVTLGILALLGLASFVDFGDFWTRFHLIAFSNDLWMLDPATDNLIRLYPPGFWLDATLLLALITALEALLVGAVGLVALARGWSAPAAVAVPPTVSRPPR